MSEKQAEQLTTDEKVHMLISIVGDMNLYFMTKFPDYIEEVTNIREQFGEVLPGENFSETKKKIMEKLREMDNE